MTAILLDTKKCLDLENMSDKCKACQKWQKRVNDPKYPDWKASHQCKINHTEVQAVWRQLVLCEFDPVYHEDLNTRTCLVTVTLPHIIIL